METHPRETAPIFSDSFVSNDALVYGRPPWYIAAISKRPSAHPYAFPPAVDCSAAVDSEDPAIVATSEKNKVIIFQTTLMCERSQNIMSPLKLLLAGIAFSV
jgi:hypothetical protein